MDHEAVLDRRPYFCVLPFVHLHVNENDMIKPCCYGDIIKQFPRDFDFFTDLDFQKIRSDMMEGRPVRVCENCYKIEHQGGESFRQRESLEWMSRHDVTDLDQIQAKVISYDIRNDNTCNLACRMCHPGASSQLVKEYQKIGWHVNHARRQIKLNEIVDYSSVEKVMVAGGEPTVMPEFQTFLHRLIHHGRTDIDLMVVTNATNINNKIFRLLEKFTNLSFTVSIDGYDDVNRYIRWPSHWRTITSNIHKLRAVTDRVCFSTCVSIWNVASLSRLVGFLESEYDVPVILLNQAMNPSHDAEISPFLFPDKDLALADLEKCRLSKNYEIDDFFRDRIDYFMDNLQKTSLDQTRLQKFFRYNDSLDMSRNIRLVDFVPELDRCRP